MNTRVRIKNDSDKYKHLVASSAADNRTIRLHQLRLRHLSTLKATT